MGSSVTHCAGSSSQKDLRGRQIDLFTGRQALYEQKFSLDSQKSSTSVCQIAKLDLELSACRHMSARLVRCCKTGMTYDAEEFS